VGILLEFETERLIIKLLTLSQMKLWVNNISILEKELGCKCDGPIEGLFLNIVKYTCTSYNKRQPLITIFRRLS